MRMKWVTSARFLAGAFLLFVASAAAAQIQVAAERADHRCPAGSVLGIVPLDRAELPADASRCLVLLPLADLSDAAIDAAAARGAHLGGVPAAIVEVRSPVRA